MVLALAFTTSLVHAQNNGSSYQTALGVKMYPGAISVKHFTQKGRALEGLGYLSNDGFRLTGLYELHFPIAGAVGLQWYVGGGGAITFGVQTTAGSYSVRATDNTTGCVAGMTGSANVVEIGRAHV